MQQGAFAWPKGGRIAVAVTVMLDGIARWVLDDGTEAETHARRLMVETTNR